MCGIAGIVSFQKPIEYSNLERIASLLAHRGPDDEGIEIHETRGIHIGLVHRRLSVLDLSSAGHQPMSIGVLSIVFNGEIYNYKDIRVELQTLGYRFNSDSDTEVILYAYQEWGLKCVNRFVGMFAFALLDKTKAQLHLVRDRMGLKPLYYFLDKETLIFGSEAKAIVGSGLYRKQINHRALCTYFMYGYCMGKESMFENIYKLNPGHTLTLNLAERKLEPMVCYWSLVDQYKKPRFKGTYNQAIEQLEVILTKAAMQRTIADVPIGVFLSGGYDSSLIAALIQRKIKSPLHTFTVAFEEAYFNEAPHAENVAKHIGSKHHTEICTYKQAQEFINKFSYFFDEPLADVSTLPTLLLSQITKQRVSVALSANGGDECFAGYDNYRRALLYMKRFAQISKPLRPLLGKFFKGTAPFFDAKQIRTAHNLRHMQHILSKDFSAHAFLNMLSQRQSETVVGRMLSKPLELSKTPFNLREIVDFIDNLNPIDELRLVDGLSYLPDDILVKVDRATMAFGLEGREPLLDHHVVEFAASLPVNYLSYQGQQKRILKDLCHKYIPASIMHRPKQGFTLPLYNWLKNSLKSHLLDILNEENLNRHPELNKKYLIFARDAFLTGNHHFGDVVWQSFVYLQWHKQWMQH